MNILINQIVGYGSIAGGLMPDTLQTILETYPNANVYHLTCSNSFKTCFVNYSSKPEVCFKCKKGVKKSLMLVQGNFKLLTIDDIITEEDKQNAKRFIIDDYSLDKDIRSLKYENFSIGESSLSTYISATRDRDLEKLHKDNSFQEIIENGVALYSGLKKFLIRNEINVIYNFNGRHTYHKAALDLARELGIDCYNMEVVRPGGYLVRFKNALPHNIKYVTHNVLKEWEDSTLSLKVKTKIGEDYFVKKRERVQLNDKIYTASQTVDLLPAKIDFTKRTIVLFTSSDDEFAAVGQEYDNPYFRDQNEGIFYVAELISQQNDFNLIIRMHPNLKGVNHSYANKLRSLKNKYKNVFLETPESKVDSYALLDVADKVIVFGSTIGVEANYWKKPVILLGKSFYSDMDIAYKPREKGDIKLLIKKELLPKSKIDSIKFGYYYSEGGISSRYFKNSNKKIFFKGVKLFQYTWWEHKTAKIIKIVHRTLGIRLFVN